MQKAIDIRDKDGFTIHEKWEISYIFCPNCGKMKVWKEEGPGDYYLGEDYICVACSCSFNVPCLERIENQKGIHQDRMIQRVEQLCNNT